MKIETYAEINDEEIVITAEVTFERGEYGWADSYEITEITDESGHEYELDELDDRAEERIIEAYHADLDR